VFHCGVTEIAAPAPTGPAPTAPRGRTALLLSYLRPHWPAMLLGLLLGLVANAAGLATPLVTKWVLDTLGAGGSLTRPVTVLLVLVVVGAAISLWQWVLMGGVAERVVLDARSSVVRRYFAARIDQLTRRPGGELVTRATSDPGLLHEASGSLVGLINGAVALVGTLVLMGTLDVVLLGTTLIAVVVVAVCCCRRSAGPRKRHRSRSDVSAGPWRARCGPSGRSRPAAPSTVRQR
jgi:ABC-type multidrug transport system fused ATPase/permease subunit